MAAMQSSSFFSMFDPEATMEMSKGRMFQNLRIMMGTLEDENGNPVGFGLTDKQLAAVVDDVVSTANHGGVDVDHHDHNDPVMVSEFCELTADDNCDILTLVDLYKDSRGNLEALENILDEECLKEGDANQLNVIYQKKCVTIMRDMKEGGRDRPADDTIRHNDIVQDMKFRYAHVDCYVCIPKIREYNKLTHECFALKAHD